MDPISLLVFAIYTMLILLILVYISPLLSALLMVVIPVAFVFFMPVTMVEFLTIEQFSTISPIYNFHVLLMIWSALVGIIAYSEILSWYLLSTPITQKTTPEKTPVTMKNKLHTFYQQIRKNISGEK